MTRRSSMLLAALVLIAAGCGGGDAGTGVASLQDDAATTTVAADGASEVDAEQAMLDFAECMREHGVDMADPIFDGEGGGGIMMVGGAGRVPGTGEDGGDATLDIGAIQEARDACSRYLEGITRDVEHPDQTEMQDTMYEYAECMRDNGFDMGDPTFFGSSVEDGSGAREGPFSDVDPDDPDFQAAQEACQDIFGGFGLGIRPDGGGPGDEERP
jgi:hypothetical protein